MICCHQSVLSKIVRSTVCCPSCAWLSSSGRSTIRCHQFVLHCHRWEEVRFVATSLCLVVTDGKKHALLPPVCAWLSQMGRSTIRCHQFVLHCHRWEEVRSMVCCHQSVLDCHRWEEVRCVATSLCLIVKDGKKYELLPPDCAWLSQMACLESRSASDRTLSCPGYMLFLECSGR